MLIYYLMTKTLINFIKSTKDPNSQPNIHFDKRKVVGVATQ